MTRRVAIIGGGPGGLMTAYLLQERCSVPFQATIYEATARLGGKILTRVFESAPVTYEAGAAELYDYSHVGEDPLRELIARLGLTIKPMSGVSMLMNQQIIHDLDDVGRVYGEATRRALLDFDRRAKKWSSPEDYYEADWRDSNADPMSKKTFEQELALVPDFAARNYLRTMVHSDVAAEPHATSAAYGLQNYLMNDSDYLRLYTIDGGIEELPRALAARLETRVLLETHVLEVARTANRQLRVTSREVSARNDARSTSEDYDFVVVALPNHYLPLIDWKGEVLSEAMRRHHIHYDHPAHYLRVSILFREVFWAHVLKDSYLMLDAFGGCCLYDESARNGCEKYGAMGWLLAGNAAVTLSNLSDEGLIKMVLDSLPASLRHGREMFLEGRVHRWIGEVNALPGGRTVLSMQARHVPLPSQLNLFVVGDYLFDSTLNGVLDSADYVTESLVEGLHAAFQADSASMPVDVAV